LQGGFDAPSSPIPPVQGFLGGWGNACTGHCYIFKFLKVEDIPPGGRMKQTLWKNTENAWGSTVPHVVCVAIQFPMG